MIYLPHTMEHDHSLSTKRIEMFSDGVFAIIVTLLVLDLKVPSLVQNASVSITIAALFNELPQFLSFAMSFVIVCIFWVNHHEFFSALRGADRQFLWLNNMLLFWLCFIPFPTAFIGRYPTNLVAVMLFGIVLFFAASSFSLMTYYVFFKSNLLDEHIKSKERKKAQKISYFGITLYALSVLLAPVSIYISLFIFCIVPIYYFIPRKFSFT